jgi:hypothetical protein
MKFLFSITILLSGINGFAQVKNYLFIGMDRDLLKDKKNWALPVFEGVQIAYSWRQLEHNKDDYDFSMINQDLELLRKHGKKLFIQVQDVSFSMKWIHTPDYLLKDSIYHGGANKQYKFRDNNETEAIDLGWVTRRWDTEVQKRLHKLYEALGKQFDGFIEGINTEETSVTFGNGPLHPPGFSYTRYRDAIIENLAALKKSFPRSTVIVYANFMPGGFMPGEDSTLLKSIYQFAWENHIGVGGPDLLPNKRFQMTNSYKYIANSSPKVLAGVAVQDGTQEYINPATNKIITPAEIYSFGKDYLHLNYIFWGSEEPYLHNQIIPFLTSQISQAR